jgi:hypothetical protein
MDGLEIRQKIFAEINSSLVNEELYVKYHNGIAKVLREKYSGKQLTKRLEGHVRTELGLSEKTTIRFCNDYLLKLEIWTDYNERMTFYMGHERDRIVYDPRRFEEQDACHGAAAEARNEVRKGLLTDGIDEVIEAVLKKQAAKQALADAEAELNRLTEEFPEAWFIQKL